ncbi:hypothetical protein JCM5350_000539 [Sporobolomyces pararoseus]
MVRVRSRSGGSRSTRIPAILHHSRSSKPPETHADSLSDHAHSSPSHSVFSRHEPAHSPRDSHSHSSHSPHLPQHPHSPHSHSIFGHRSHSPHSYHPALFSPPPSPIDDKAPYRPEHVPPIHHEIPTASRSKRRDSVMSELENETEIGHLPDNTIERFQLVGEELKFLAQDLLHHWAQQYRNEAKMIEKMIESWHDEFLEAILPKGDGAWYLLDDKDFRTIIEKLKDLKEKHIDDFFMQSHGGLVVADRYRVNEVVVSMKLRKHRNPPAVADRDHRHHLFGHSSSHSSKPESSHNHSEHSEEPHAQSSEKHRGFGGLFPHHNKPHEEHHYDNDKSHEDSHHKENHKAPRHVNKSHESSHEEKKEEETHESKETSLHRGLVRRRSPPHTRPSSRTGIGRHFRTRTGRTHRSLSHEDYRIGHRQAARHGIETYGYAENGGLRLVPPL